MKKKLASVIFAASTAALGGCNGWPGTVPYAQAEHKPEKYETYMYAAPESVPVFTVGEHRWMVLPTGIDLRAARTRAVGSAGGMTALALDYDVTPYSHLFVQTADGRTRAAAAID